MVLIWCVHVQVSLKNSPINAGKKALAKAQAHIFGLGCKVVFSAYPPPPSPKKRVPIPLDTLTDRPPLPPSPSPPPPPFTGCPEELWHGLGSTPILLYVLTHIFLLDQKCPVHPSCLPPASLIQAHTVPLPPPQTQVALKNSPINAGKKALAKAQAGEYDAAATRAKIEQYIKDNKVIVFSW